MNEELVYIAFRPCGCVTLATMAAADCAPREVARAIRAGETVRSMPVGDIPRQWRCAEHPRKVKQP